MNPPVWSVEPPLPVASPRRRGSDRGAVATEYGLLAVLVIIAIVGAVTLIGPRLSQIFEVVSAHLP
jgi:Flp pilus assembly pilin Flp